MTIKKILTGMALLLMGMTIQAGAYQKTESGVRANVRSIDVELQFYSPSIMRVLKYPAGKTPVKKSYSVIKEAEKVHFSVTGSGPDIILESDSMKVTLDTQTGKVTFNDRRGRSLLAEKDLGTQFTPVEYGDNRTYMVRQAFLLDKDEAIYGLGQHQKGKMNQRNQMVSLHQKNTEIAIPIFQSTKGYGVFWDNYSPTTFTDNEMETAFDSQAGRCADY